MLNRRSIQGWPIVTLEEVAEVRTGLAKGQKNLTSPVKRPYLRVANVQDGFLELSEIKTIEVGALDVGRYQLKAGDVLLTEGGDFDKLGRGTVWRDEIDGCLHQNHIFAVRPDSERVLSEFLAYQTASPRGKRYFMTCSKQSTNLASINSTQLKQFPLPLPPYNEQRRIVEVLHTWDKAIEMTGQLIERKSARRDQFRRDLVSWSRWPKRALGSFVSPVSRSVPTPTTIYTALGIRSHGKGTFQRVVERPEEIDMETVYVVGPKDLIVNITFAWEGAIALARQEDAGCYVSHRFPTFDLDEKQINRDFLGYAVRTRRFFHYLGIASPGGAGRNRVLNKQDFLSIDIPFPPRDQQDCIADVLGTADREIALLESERAALERQKRGLMQKLLTGEWRVPRNRPSTETAMGKAAE